MLKGNFKDIAIPKDWTTARQMRGAVPSGEAGKVPLLHAAVIAISSSGSTGYYEYGRYDDSTTNGVVRNIGINDFAMTNDGYPTRESLTKLFNIIETRSIFEAKGAILDYLYYPGVDYDKVIAYVENRQNHPKEYILGWNDCMSFASEAIQAGKSWLSTSYGITSDGRIYSIPFYYLND